MDNPIVSGRSSCMLWLSLGCLALVSAAASAQPRTNEFRCDLASVDLPEGAVGPTFDSADWSPFGARSGVTFVVTLDPAAVGLQPFRTQILACMEAACARWGQVLNGANVTIEVSVLENNQFPRATGYSLTSAFVRQEGGLRIYEQAVAHEVRTGVDPNGNLPDLIVTLNQSYTSGELWFDPAPGTRTLPVPTNRTDAVSVFLHEIGHAVAFNGWRDNTSGQLPDDYASTFDAHTEPGVPQWFSGPISVARYAGSVPLTYANAKHVGNDPPHPGTDLISDLMNGVVFYRGYRYDISNLNLAVCRDCG
ncbi:MAG: hypothetical protein ACOYN0_11730, partial [Phycisphaerales bacterium]